MTLLEFGIILAIVFFAAAIITGIISLYRKIRAAYVKDRDTPEPYYPVYVRSAPASHDPSWGSDKSETPASVRGTQVRYRDRSLELERDVARRAHERVEARRSAEVAQRAVERQRHEEEIRRSRSVSDNPAAGSIFPDFTTDMPSEPRTRLGDEGYTHVSNHITPGGGSSGGGGASESWSPAPSFDTGSYSSDSGSSSSPSSSD